MRASDQSAWSTARNAPRCDRLYTAHERVDELRASSSLPGEKSRASRRRPFARRCDCLGALGVIAEHRVYVRKACSFFCTGHLGLEVLRDAGFSDPMQRYEELYAEYFELYCRVNCAAPDAAADPRRALLPLLKHQLNEWRRAILQPRAELPRLLRDAELRRPTGDTQKHRILPWPKDSD